MQYKRQLLSVAFATAVFGAYAPPEPWSTLTPSGTFSGGISDYTSTFGLAVQPIHTEVSVKKRGESVVLAISQIHDGQIQATTSTGKVPQPAKATPVTVVAISQIHDGQVQAPTTTVTERLRETVQVVSQIHDGQVQAPIKTLRPKTVTEHAISQIHDGQIQAPVATKHAISQIHDGQIQAPTAVTTTEHGVSQVHDGQVEATSAAESESEVSGPVRAVSCKVSGTLQLTLKDGILRDEKGRIGSIVANHQFQFDGPPPQAGAIYAAGWSITPEGRLALGDNDVFYQCLSGDFYNLYNEKIGAQCHPIYLEVVDLVEC